MMNGTFLDLAAIITGGFIGFFAKSKVLTDDMQAKAMQALAICAFLTGLVGVGDIANPVVCVLSIVIGSLLGNVFSLEDRLVWCFNKVAGTIKGSAVPERFVEGIITFSMLSITGSMAIVGPISNAINGDITILMTKSVLDFVVAILFGVTFGLSVVLSVVVVLFYQGIFSSLAYALIPFMTNEVIGDMSCIGSLLIFLVGFNLLKMTDIKTMNMTPAIFLPILLHMIVK